MPKPLAKNIAPILLVKLLVLMMSISARLFSVRATTGVFWGLGYLISFTRPREVAISSAQISMVKRISPELCTHPFFTKKSSEAASRLIFAHAAKSFAEVLLLPLILKNRDKFVDEENDSLADEIIDARDGAVCLSGHLGCFELIAAHHIAKDIRISSVARYPNIRFLGVMIEHIRLTYGLHVIWRDDKHSARKLFKSLRAGNYLASIIDQDVDLDNKFVSFFGLSAAYPISPIRMAIRAKRPILASFIVRTAPAKHKILYKKIEYNADDPQADDKVLEHFNRLFEEIVSEYPDQWIWWHRRWRRRPSVDYTKNPEKLRNRKEYLEWVSNIDVASKEHE